MRQHLIASVVVLLFGVSCADNVLSGSLSEVFPLEVSRTEIVANGDALQVTYLHNRDTFLDVVVRLSVAVGDLTLKPGLKIPLQGESASGALRCVASHAPGGEPVRTLPHIKRGDMNLAEGGTPGAITRGDFSVLFESEGGDLGYNRTLAGTFAGIALDDHSGTIEGATQITVGDWATSGEIQFDNDQDVFTFAAESGALDLRLETTGAAIQLRVEQASGELAQCRIDPAATESDCVFTGPGAYVFHVPAVGQYALKVSGASTSTRGVYTVRILR